MQGRQPCSQHSTHTDAPSQTRHLLVCSAEMTMLFHAESPGNSFYNFFHFHKNRDFFFFSPVPGDADPKHTPLKQSHVSSQNNWHIFFWLGINHTSQIPATGKHLLWLCITTSPKNRWETWKNNRFLPIHAQALGNLHLAAMGMMLSLPRALVQRGEPAPPPQGTGQEKQKQTQQKINRTRVTSAMDVFHLKIK